MTQQTTPKIRRKFGLPARFFTRGNVYSSLMLRHYLWFSALAVISILSVITAIDISSEIGDIWAQGLAEGQFYALGRSCRYVFLRLLDNASQTFSISFLLGVIWGEIVQVTSGRLLAMRTAGISFRRRLRPVIVLSLVAVSVQFALTNLARPYAVMALSKENLGAYGHIYQRNRADDFRWLAFGETLVHARIRDFPELHFSDAIIYRFGEDGRLSRLATADRIVAQSGANDRWVLKGAYDWEVDKETPIEGQKTPPVTSQHFDEMPLELPISRNWLQYRQIAPKYIPLIDLVQLAQDPHLPDVQPNYAGWVTIRLGQAVLVGLASVMSFVILAFTLDIAGVIFAGLAGLASAYLGYFAIKVAVVAADVGGVSAVLAFGAVAFLFVSIGGVFLALIEKRETP